MGEKDMSSSIPFSTGRQMSLERNIEDDARPDHSHQTPKRNRQVIDIAKYFELGMGGIRKDVPTVKMNNNTAVYMTDKVPIIPIATPPNNRQLGGLVPRSVHPMRRQELSHVTEDVTSQPAEPIRHQESQKNQRPALGSHL